jgi:ATP-dependent exoDNAse (exonuclease V) beta subunit
VKERTRDAVVAADAAQAAAASDLDSAVTLDARARIEALDPGRSLLLQAPAGSGKTTVLTARFLTLLTRVDWPEEILAITFTRKAAAQMRHRILAALQAVTPAATPRGIDPGLLQAVRQRDRQLGWDLLHNPVRLRIETIDALNGRLARALPVSARSGSSLTIARSPALLYQRAARRALDSAWLEERTRASVQLLFERLDNSWPRLQRLLAQMLERRSHWLPRVLQAADTGLVQRVQGSLQSLLRAELAALSRRLPAAMLQEGEQLLSHAEGVLGLWQRNAVPLVAEPASLLRWRALSELALTSEGWRRRFTIQQGFERGDQVMKQRAAAWIAALECHPGAEHCLRAIQALPDPILGALDRSALAALALLLPHAAAHLQLVFADSGKVDHAYIAGAARASLTEQGEPSEFALRTGNALRHILMDEFQDTSFEQFELLRALTAGWEPGDGRTLFLVGDPMQSIYQFREAEVGLFLQARDYGIGALAVAPLQLRRNFRARATLLDWINQRFARLFPADDDARLAAIRYLSSVPVDEAAGTDTVANADAGAATDAAGADEAAVTLHRFDAADRVGEAARVLEIVRAARARAPASSIAVLVASREHATTIAATLRAGAIALRGVDLEPLRDRPVVRELAALTRALLHGQDRGAWLTLLRGPWCALTLAQLQWLCEQDRADMFATLLAAAQALPQVQRVCAALEPALRGSERGLPLWQRLERCWLRLAGPAVYPRDPDRLDARRFIDALALHDDPESLVGEAVGEITRPLYSSEIAPAGAVEIMTVHAAKGLEWDVVILPGLGRRTASDTDPLLHWIELPRAGQDSELLLSPIRSTVQEPRASLAAYIKRLRRERSRIERVRLLYVAATRARKALHLLGALKPPAVADTAAADAATADTATAAAADTNAGAVAAAPPGSLLELLWPAIGEEFASLPSATATAAAALVPGAAGGVATAFTTPPPLWRLPAHWSVPPPPPPPRPRRVLLASAAPAVAPEYSWVGLAARAVGTIVHAELHRLALTSPLPAAAALATDAHPPRYRQWLAELGVEQHERDASQAQIMLALRRTLEDPRGRWLLSDAHRQAHSEWRLTGVHAGRVVSVVFDRMLLDEQGRRWIVDFKTSAHEGGAMEQFLDSEVERYRAQLLRYAALARGLGPEPVYLALYFPLLGAWRELAA